MAVGEKKYKKLSERMYRKVFNKDDPFDQLIILLAKKGVLNICAIDIGREPGKHPRYFRKPNPLKEKHSS